MRARILIMEDDQGINQLLTLHLKNENMEVVSTYDGEEALQAFDENFHLVILDVMVPKLDGFQVLKKIRERSTVPVIFLTARTDEIDKLNGLGIGADDYITKPFSVMEVIYRVKANLRRNYEYINHQSTSDVLEHKGLAMDLGEKRITLDGQDVQLNAKEYELLQCFMENPGRVYTKKQLYEKVWDEMYVGDDNTVMVHISRLREKLSDTTKSPRFIKTIKGLGYRMEKE